MYRHEHTASVFDRGFAQTAVDAGIDVESNDAAREILHTRTRSICGERKKFGNTRQLTCPVLELTGKSAVRFVDPTESPFLPDGEVRVLDRKRRPVWRLTSMPCRVRAHHVERQRCHRESVGADVMDDHGQDVIFFVDLDQFRPDRWSLRDVEAPRGETFDLPEYRFGVCGDNRQRAQRFTGFDDHLRRHSLDHGKQRAQRFVASKHVGDRALQHGNVQPASQPDRYGDVVRRGRDVELIDEPHALLCQRQRDRLWPRQCLERKDCRSPSCRGALDRQLRNGRRVEQLSDRQVQRQRIVHARHSACSDEAVSADLEEVVVNTDCPGFQKLLEDRRQLRFERCSRRQIRLRAVEAGRGQSLPIKLAGRTEREHVEGDDHSGNHVGRKETSQLGA